MTYGNVPFRTRESGLTPVHQFACRCGHHVQFNDRRCRVCGDEVGFDPRIFSVVSLAAHRTVERLRYCRNAEWGACNWVIGESDPQSLCLGCQPNRVIPDLDKPGNQAAWMALEQAKKHLIYQILRLRLPIDDGNGAQPLQFDFVEGMLTGHMNGLITVNLGEANPVERERQRQLFGEPHRTLVGHMRHESGHYFWMRLIEDTSRLFRFRELFGDERQDYAGALDRHHADGAPADWPSHHVGPMPARIPGRTGPRPGRTTCTWSRRWTPPTAWACV